MQKSHRLVRIVVALGATIATLSACGSSSGGGATITADEIREQESQTAAQQEVEQTSAPEEEPQAKPKPKPKAKPKPKPEPEVGSTATNADLDAYVAAGEKALDEMFGDAFEKIYSEIDIVPVYPNGIAYDYTFRVAVDPAAAAPQMDAQEATLRTQARTVVIPEMKRQGFANPTVTYTYRNPDGSVVWSRTVS